MFPKNLNYKSLVSHCPGVHYPYTPASRNHHLSTHFFIWPRGLGKSKKVNAVTMETGGVGQAPIYTHLLDFAADLFFCSYNEVYLTPFQWCSRE